MNFPKRNFLSPFTVLQTLSNERNFERIKTIHMKSKLIIIIAAILVSASLSAQKTKKAKTSSSAKTEKVYVAPAVVEEVREEISIATVDESTPEINSFEPVKNIRFSNKYEIYSGINDNYDLYCEKYSKNRYNNLGIVDKEGNVVLPHLFGKSYGNSSKNEIILYISNNYGLFNVNELRWVIPMEYEELSDLSNNLYAAKKNGKWGVIDNNNKEIVPFEWYQVNSISNLENYIMVTATNYSSRLSGVYSLAERKMVVPCIYSSIRKLDRLNYFQVNNGSKYNIININNETVFKTWYDNITTPSSGRNYFIVKLDGKYGVVDDNEKIIIPLEYTEFSQYPYSDGSYLARNKDGKYGFILIDGRITLPFEYDNLTKSYSDNVLSVRNGKCGLVQVNSGLPYEIVTCDYDNIKTGNKTFIVEKEGKFGLLDLYGKALTNIEYESIEAIDSNSDNIIYKAKKDGLYTLINEQGKPIGQESFLDFATIEKKNVSSYYSPRFTYIKAKTKNGKYCVIDKVGKVITKPLFDDILTENDNVFIVKLKNKCGLYSLLEQKQLVDFTYDLIVKNGDNYFGMTGKNVDILTIKSGLVNKTTTIK